MSSSLIGIEIELAIILILHRLKLTNLIYHNMTLNNDTKLPILASIIDRRAQDIISSPQQYEMSIVRFQLNAQLIPIFIPNIPNPALPNETDMSISLEYGGVTAHVQVPVSDLELKGVYSYNVFLDHVNEAVNGAFQGILTPAVTATAPPMFFLECHTSLISMYVQEDYLKSNPNHIKIYFNQELMNILNLPYTNYNGSALDGKDYEVDIKNYIEVIPPIGDRAGHPYAVQAIPGTVLQLCQEFVSLNTWSGVKSIVFSSDLIPVAKEFLPNTTNEAQNTNFSNSTLSILTDFDLDQSAGPGSNVRGVIEYIPSEYRMKSLRGKNSFDAIDCRVHWQDFQGRTYPVYLAPKTSMSLKIMFRKI